MVGRCSEVVHPPGPATLKTRRELLMSLGDRTCERGWECNRVAAALSESPGYFGFPVDRNPLQSFLSRSFQAHQAERLYRGIACWSHEGTASPKLLWQPSAGSPSFGTQSHVLIRSPIAGKPSDWKSSGVTKRACENALREISNISTVWVLRLVPSSGK